ncbi:MAG: DNA polymerase III subunit gamma and tau [Microcella sp.]|uniref:DNA polymerase III subunit gamma and tau n=1 Tax=Microcella sp. TaxID=1913979 RepID=UPI0024CBE3FE|nr:DNA polymerase III subunit gamma and tau [Microcella sp.]UYN82719.1 MAG: DNA polymerase III subunit gamma and tau [Microcella sp.]
MVTALYRRYRPETFAELIGQSHVTDPLRAALRGDRVNHAYLFSGPRGCGKTTSARILARCLNCAEGPTDTPCGVCPSCVELGRDGGGSLDVVEIDAASHNGVDDARDLRERAVFAPARDRYKIFILDEAHMVTPQGFNALLKIVEEPPEHIKFIFATTEPEKVIGTIRSRTHHYPFRLVPPAQLLDYVQQLSDSEKVTIEPGVLPLVVRAGGGSVRDTLSLLDQLIAGSDESTVTYARAVALLGYTHGALLDEVVVAISARDAAAAFSAVDRVIQTGQDPRRFVDDLLERLRDLIVVQATADNAATVLHGIPDVDLQSMRDQADGFAPAELSRAADVVNRALTEMTGATSPRLHLELMTARVLVALGGDEAPKAPVAAAPASAAPAAAPPQNLPAPKPAVPDVAAPKPAVPDVASPKPAVAAEPTPARAPLTIDAVREAWPAVLDAVQQVKRSSWTVVFATTPAALDEDVLTISFTSEADAAAFKERAAPADSVSEHVRAAIERVTGVRVKFRIRVEPGQRDVARSEAATPSSATDAPADAASDPDPAATRAPGDPGPPAPTVPAAAVTDWVVAPIPRSTTDTASVGQQESASTPPTPRPSASAEPAATEPASAQQTPPESTESTEPIAEAAVAPKPAGQHPAEAAGRQRYGEAVVREVLGATFLLEEVLEPTVSPVSSTSVSTPAGPVDLDRPSSADAPDPFRDEG